MIPRLGLKIIVGCFVVTSIVSLSLYAATQSAESPSAETAAASRPSLDYEIFKTRVEPIFLKRRSPNHARCYACHEKTKHFSGLMLESLPPGGDFWTEEQSRRNFATVSKLVVPGNLNASMFPMHPLAPEAGGDTRVHNGGRQFESQDDPDFKTIAEWIRGQKAGHD